MNFKSTNLKAILFALAILFAGAIHLSATIGFMQKWWPQATQMSPVATATTNVIQVALLLDTSNSMDGLIEQAKSQLWKILNELARARKEGQGPELQIALYEYGNSRLAITDGYIRQVQGFTSDMDLLSEKLFSLTTSGGDEYCGQVIHTALNELKWNIHSDALRLIYIAGNEPFTQGHLPYAQACAWAVDKDVIVNTIFCGDYEEGIQVQWQSGAKLGKGAYSNIDHNAVTTFIETPYDEKITQLNQQLNATYLAYGAQGQDFKMNQTAQDQNALKYSKANVADRALFKSSANYSNAQWDLVDAYKKDKKILTQQKENLPDSLKQLSLPDLEKEVQHLIQERERINQKIRELGDERRAYLETEQANRTGDTTNSLEGSILKALREQARQKGFVIE